MALAFSLQEGDDFYVADERFVVEEIVSPLKFRLISERTKREFVVTDTKGVEIAADVIASAGDMAQPQYVRLALRAPRAIKILRGELYRAGGINGH